MFLIQLLRDTLDREAVLNFDNVIFLRIQFLLARDGAVFRHASSVDADFSVTSPMTVRSVLLDTRDPIDFPGLNINIVARRSAAALKGVVIEVQGGPDLDSFTRPIQAGPSSGQPVFNSIYLMIFQILPINKSTADPFEDHIKRLFSLLQKKMNMVSHQTVGKELILTYFFTFSQNRKESKIVFLVFKQLLLIDPPQHRMIHSGGAFLSLCSRHFPSPILLYRLDGGFVKIQWDREPSPVPHFTCLIVSLSHLVFLLSSGLLSPSQK